MKKLSFTAGEELSALRARVSHRREYLDILEIELINTRAALQDFTKIYSIRITPLEMELSRLKKLLAESLDSTKSSTDKAKEGRGSHHRSGSPGKDGARTNGRTSRLPSTKNPVFERKVRELFRNLAKRFHPDLTHEPEEKKQREQIMTQINRAYSARDLRTLEALAKQGTVASNGKSGSAENEILRLKVELRHLEAMIFEVEHTIRELDFSPAMQLRTEANIESQAGRDLLGEMEENLNADIVQLREDLLDLGVEPQLVNA